MSWGEYTSKLYKAKIFCDHKINLFFNKTTIYLLLSFQNIVEINEFAVSVTNPSARISQQKKFIFDSVYNMKTDTEVIYDEMCYSLVESTIEGYNGTIFAYGQTGCGKTHTMQVLVKICKCVCM